MCTYIYMYIYIHTYIYIYTYIYIHIHSLRLCFCFWLDIVDLTPILEAALNLHTRILGFFEQLTGQTLAKLEAKSAEQWYYDTDVRWCEQCSKPLLIDACRGLDTTQNIGTVVIQEGNLHEPTRIQWNDRGIFNTCENPWDSWHSRIWRSPRAVSVASTVVQGGSMVRHQSCNGEIRRRCINTSYFPSLHPNVTSRFWRVPHVSSFSLQISPGSFGKDQPSLHHDFKRSLKSLEGREAHRKLRMYRCIPTCRVRQY